jgi:hypothetical protein
MGIESLYALKRGDNQIYIGILNALRKENMPPNKAYGIRLY